MIRFLLIDTETTTNTGRESYVVLDKLYTDVSTFSKDKATLFNEEDAAQLVAFNDKLEKIEVKVNFC